MTSIADDCHQAEEFRLGLLDQFGVVGAVSIRSSRQWDVKNEDLGGSFLPTMCLSETDLPRGHTWSLRSTGELIAFGCVQVPFR